MPNLVPPKIPDGERVDFDVSGDCWSSSSAWGVTRARMGVTELLILGAWAVAAHWPGGAGMAEVQALSPDSTLCIEPTVSRCGRLR